MSMSTSTRTRPRGRGPPRPPPRPSPPSSSYLSYSSSSSLTAVARAVPRFAATWAVVTPLIATLQGALLLYDYRAHHHRNDDDPDTSTTTTSTAAQRRRRQNPELMMTPSSSRGVVIVRPTSVSSASEGSSSSSSSSSSSFSSPGPSGVTSRPFLLGMEGRRRQRRQRQRQQPDESSQPLLPLRVLVLGDSLAAGVGQHSSTVLPVLPQSLASSLSQQLGGRPVYWTCVGSPGLSATEVLEVIHSDLPALQFPALIGKLVDYWHDHHKPREFRQTIQHMRTDAEIRWHTFRLRSWRWMSQIGQPVQLPDDHNDDDASNPASDENTRSGIGGGGGPAGSDVPSVGPLRWAHNRWRRARIGVERDFRNFQRIFDGSVASSEEEGENAAAVSDLQRRRLTRDCARGRHERVGDNDDDDDDDDGVDDDNPHGVGDEASSTASRVRRMVRTNRLDPSFVNQYDVAIVLTGLNDLKDAFLPFMMSQQRSQRLSSARRSRKSRNHGADDEFAIMNDNVSEEEGAEEGHLERFKDELLRIVEALRGSANRTLPPREGEIASSTSSRAPAEVQAMNSPTPEATTRLSRKPSQQNQKKLPLIVFPALPLEPIELSQRAPLSWFVVPIVRGMDRSKQVLAELHPDSVLFVPSPPSTVFSDAEARRGPLWEGIQGETVLLKLADISRTVKRRFQSLLLTDAGTDDDARGDRTLRIEDGDDDDTASLYQLAEDGVELVPKRAGGGSAHDDTNDTPRHPGSTMVSGDGIHPNDRGYELWGKYIARAIVEHWEAEKIIASEP